MRAITMKDLFTKEYWQWNWERYKGLQKYIVAALKLPNVIMRFGMFFGLLFGIALFEIAYYFTGNPYTLICIFIGLGSGLFVAEGLAKKQMLKLEEEEDEEAQATEATEATNAEPVNLNPLTFDANKGILSYHGKTCKIPLKRYQHIVCTKLFERPGVRINDRDILIAIDWTKDARDSDRLVRDAVRAICIKAKANLGIENALVWESLTSWANDIYLR